MNLKSKTKYTNPKTLVQQQLKINKTKSNQPILPKQTT